MSEVSAPFLSLLTPTGVKLDMHAGVDQIYVPLQGWSNEGLTKRKAEGLLALRKATTKGFLMDVQASGVKVCYAPPRAGKTVQSQLIGAMAQEWTQGEVTSSISTYPDNNRVLNVMGNVEASDQLLEVVNQSTGISACFSRLQFCRGHANKDSRSVLVMCFVLSSLRLQNHSAACQGHTLL